ncbi:MAG: hypothetical protein ACOX6T_19995 [Myxococcales bacterium]|jgi:hypothetical protein
MPLSHARVQNRSGTEFLFGHFVPTWFSVLSLLLVAIAVALTWGAARVLSGLELVLALVLTGGIAALLLGSKWIRLSVRKNSVQSAWGLFVPWSWSAGRPLTGVERVVITVEERPTRYARRHGVWYTVFVVALRFSRTDRLVVQECGNRHEARAVARQLARALELDIEDRIDDGPRVILFSELGTPLVERLQASGTIRRPPTPRPGLRISTGHRGGAFCLELPTRGFVAWDIPSAMLLMCIGAVGIPFFYVLPSAGQLRAAALAAELGTLAVFVCVLVWVLRRTTTRSTFLVSERGLEVLLESWVSSECHRFALSEIEDIDLRVVREEREPVLVVEATTGILVLGEGIAEGDLGWARAALIAALLRAAEHEPSFEQLST